MKPGQMFHAYFRRLCDAYRFEMPVALETQSILTVPSMVSAGIGAALVPNTLAPLCGEKHVPLYSLGTVLPANEVSIVWKKGRYRSRAVKRFAEMAVQRLRSEEHL